MTELEAANKALALLGVAPIGSLNDGTNAARTVKRLLPLTMKAVLSEFAWSFAVRLQPLSLLNEAAPAGYLYVCEYPADAVYVKEVYDDCRRKVRYDVTNAGGKKKICTSRMPLNAECVIDVPLNSWDNLAADALTYRLASDCASALNQSIGVANALLERYSLLAAMARNASTTEGEDRVQSRTRYIDVRFM